MVAFLLIFSMPYQMPKSVFYLQPTTETLHVNSSLNEWKTFCISIRCHLKCSWKNNVHFCRLNSNFLICLLVNFISWPHLTSSWYKIFNSHSSSLYHSRFTSILFNHVKIHFLLLLLLSAIPHLIFHSLQIFHFPTLWILTRLVWPQGVCF